MNRKQAMAKAGEKRAVEEFREATVRPMIRRTSILETRVLESLENPFGPKVSMAT